MSGVAGFVCVPMSSARITRLTCTARYAAAMREARAGEPAIRFPVCRGCEIGGAHSDGKAPDRWPDGSPIVKLWIGAAPGAAPSAAPSELPHVPARPRASWGSIRQPRTPKTSRAPERPTKAPRARNVSPTETRPVVEPETPAVPPTMTATGQLVLAIRGAVGFVRDEIGLASRAIQRDPRAMERHPGKPRRIIEVDGVRDSVAGWARRNGVARTMIAERLRRGWPDALAVTLPRGAILDSGRTQEAPPAPVSSATLARVLEVVRALGIVVERIGHSPRGDVLVIREESTHVERDHASGAARRR